MRTYEDYWVGEFSDGEFVVFAPELQNGVSSDEVNLWSHVTCRYAPYKKDIARKALRKPSNGAEANAILAIFFTHFPNLAPYTFLKGNWDSGLAVNLHTLKSIPVGVNEFGHTIFDTTYTRLGELVHKCKYHNDRSVIPEIVSNVAPAVGVLGEFHFIVPVPPSNVRAFQPVTEIAKSLGERLRIPQLNGCFNSKPHLELKGISDPERRLEILRSSITVAQIPEIENRSILVFDDLYRSGATLRVVCDLLRQYKPAKLCVLCLTITRTKK